MLSSGFKCQSVHPICMDSEDRAVACTFNGGNRFSFSPKVDFLLVMTSFKISLPNPALLTAFKLNMY